MMFFLHDVSVFCEYLRGRRIPNRSEVRIRVSPPPADYSVNAAFRRGLHRVLNVGEAEKAMKRAITPEGQSGAGQAGGRDAGRGRCDELARQHRDAMHHLADAAVFDRWVHRRQVVPPELIGRIAPTRWRASYAASFVCPIGMRRASRIDELLPIVGSQEQWLTTARNSAD